MIPRLVAAAFPSTIRARGDQYFASGRVQVAVAKPTSITAVVEGTLAYVVEIAASRGRLTAMCTCPYAAGNGVCKHIWATLRCAASERQLDALVETTGKNPSFVALSEDEFDELADEADDDDLYDEGDDDDRLYDADENPPFEPEWRPPPRTAKASRRPAPKPARPPEWKALLDGARRQMEYQASRPNGSLPAAWPADRRLVYVVDLAATANAAGVVVELATERLGRDGTWEPPAQLRLPTAAWQTIPDPRDRQIAQMLIGAAPPNPYDYGGQRSPGPFVLAGPAIANTLPLICETGRCRVRRPGEQPTDPVGFDHGPPWTLHVRVARAASGEISADAVLRRPGEEMPLGEPAMLHSGGMLLARGAFARFDDGGAFALVPLFRETARLAVSERELPAFLESLYALPRRPEVELPAGTHVAEVRDPPQAGIVVHPDPSPWRKTHHWLEPFFRYGALRLTGTETASSLFDRDALIVRHRDLAYERDAHARLVASGAKEEYHYGNRGKCLAIHGNKLGRVIADLLDSGWRVEADGGTYRPAGDMRATVRSGIDWFELSARVRFGDAEVTLQELLAARRTGATTIALPDGDVGLIPVEWLARLAPLAAGGTPKNGALRFARSQTALIEALLAAAPEPDVDAAFERARAELRSFDRVAPVDPPPTFRGTLREYQREGLGWLHFLRTFGLGGCLADDMGLGKTIQVLALLDARRAGRQSPRRPSIVVVPRSLIFNWLREAERFTPKLRLLDFTGTARRVEDIGAAHVVVTTYGTLRRDAARLAAIDFDYAILDEAQAIKSSGSASAKAARLLRARHRLAMTGTPIENRLEELWSLIEFLNPGMLGASTTFSALARLSRADAAAPAADRGVLARALRPVILRRTKAQVATELPARIEQTLHVELEGAQRKFYDDLLDSYRSSVRERVERVGLGKARMHILEALLRLRQAACHPVLADPRKTSAPSAKLDALVPALDEVVAEGHKALVFSQFTSFLGLLRSRLDAAGATYEYLDGKTRDRQARVDRFQTDPSCKVFLISLKAGGQGLNLTAAEYVFILDPWWNPAVEAQAVDRAHRIGQTKQVIATRIVARDTIEEKILELQRSKRALADAILGQDQGVLSLIGKAELEMLLA